MTAVAELTRAMLALTDRLLAGTATRDEVCAWARSISSYTQPPFRGNPAADGLHTCLWNLDQRRDDRPLVRDCDLRAHVEVVRCGTGPLDAVLDGEPAAMVAIPFDELARRAGVGTTRFAIEGLGWFEIARFASPATGRCLGAATTLETVAHQFGRSSLLIERGLSVEGQLAAVRDLLDTLALSLDDLVHVRESLISGLAR